MEFKSDIGKPWRYEEDGFTVTRSSVWSPPGCHPVGCSLKLYVDKDGRLDHVEGDENDPVTHGRLCPRCLALKDYIYNPSRVVYPMRRDPADRGKDKWERTTWDEALALIKKNYEEITGKFGKESMVVFQGTGRNGMLTANFIMTIFKTPNVVYTQSGYACYQPRSFTAQFVAGTFYPEVDTGCGLVGGMDNPEYVLPEVVVMWGKDPLQSNPDGFFGHSVIDLMKRGTKLIVVDPRVNWLSTRALVHLRVRPGTDAAMAMCWANVIISEKLYDEEFVDRWCYGFDEFAQRIADMTPERAAEICEVEAEDILRAVRAYASAKPAAIAWGLAFDQNWNGAQAAHGVVACIALTGNLDVPGGNVVGQINTTMSLKKKDGEEADDEVELDEEGQDGAQTGGLSKGTKAAKMGWYAMDEETRNKCIGADKYPFFTRSSGPNADCMLDALETDQPYPLRMAWIQSSNFLAPTNSAETDRWHDALVKSIKFAFGTDCFITPTIQACCDVFLPLATVAEQDCINQTHYGSATMNWGASSKAINVGEAHSDQEIEVLLAKTIGHGAEKFFDTAIDWFEAVRLHGERTFEEMRVAVKTCEHKYYRKYEKGMLRPDGQVGFNTPSGRVELWSSMYIQAGENPLPYYKEPPYSPKARPDLVEEYPFILTTGARRIEFFHSEHRQIPRLRELNPDPLLEINPDDARELGLTDSQWVSIENLFGEAKLKAKISPIVRRGTVMAQHGWWFPERDPEEPSLFDVWQSNVNTLIPVHHNNPMGYTAPYKSMNCKVTPLSESYDTDMSVVWEKFGKLVSTNE